MSPALQTAPKTNDLSKRRRFQPPITTFFSSSSESASACDAHISHNHYSARTYSPTPTVPATVQSSLLSVGMRVRKSVADGYKTNGSKIDAKTTFPSYDPTALRRNAGAHAELPPFCGTDYNHNGDQLITDDGDAFSLPASSQESAASYPTQPTAQKRTFGDDWADDECDFDSDSSTTLHPSNGHSLTSTAGRRYPAPTLGHQRRRFVALQQQQRTMDVDDFDEPSFLRRREEVDMDYVPGRESGYEIQMGGI
ncbi:uncharacterized protein KD926_004799 [Aspergillus affinis]|uniref:uncharacterized protein n=1 Tax=Aspergillus affinis TaxID=1070780 RepID=UPI0022FDFBEE|nr:uncharacterized protein KD926_004799 [Aspergillus affinis]KAI9043008.1 hypothetical protein KD926_004799 [Aspergillus affinis]